MWKTKKSTFIPSKSTFLNLPRHSSASTSYTPAAGSHTHWPGFRTTEVPEPLCFTGGAEWEGSARQLCESAHSIITGHPSGHSEEVNWLWKPWTASPLCVSTVQDRLAELMAGFIVLPGGDKGTFSELLLQLFMVIGNRPAGTARIHRKISNFLLFLFATLSSNVIKTDN